MNTHVFRALSDQPLGPDDLLRHDLGGQFLCRTDRHDCRVYSRVADAAPHWRKLDESARQTPFQQFFWGSAVAETVARDPDIEPVIIVTFEAGVPRLLLPLAIRRSWIGRRLVWLGDPVNDYNAPVICRDLDQADLRAVIPAIFEALRTSHSPIDAMHFVREPGLSDLLPLRGFFTGGIFGFQPPGTGTIEAEYDSHIRDLTGDWEETYGLMRSAKSRRRLRSKYNSLRKLGRVSFRKVRRPAERLACATHIMDLKSSQLDGTGKNNPFGPQAGPLRHVIENALAADDSNLGIYGLFLNGEMLAGMIAFATGDTFSLFVTAYEPEKCKNCSPGAILLINAMELSTRAGMKSFDFLIGDEPYKLEWTNRRVAIRHELQAFTLRGAFYCLLESRRLKLKKWLMARPKAMALIRKLSKSQKSVSIRRASGVPVSNQQS